MNYQEYIFIENYNYDIGWDSFAIDYSKLLQPNTIYTLTKELMYEIVEQYIDFSKQKTVLDIGCGTGNDFPFFLKNKCKVIACDYSKGMLNKAYEKYFDEINSENISLLMGSLENLELNTFKENSFDLVYSITGGLSYIDDTELQTVLSKMKTFLKPNGKIIIAHFSRFCLAESLYYLRKFKFKQVFTRLKSQIKVNIKGKDLIMHLRSPKSIKKIVGKDFNLVGIHPLLALTPPYQTKYSPSKKKLENYKKKELKLLDNQNAALFADQFITVLSKK